LIWQQGDGERTLRIEAPQGRKIVLVGDLVDRGPRTPDVIRIAMAAAEVGGYVVQGNHDNKFARWMDGRNVKIGHGLQQSIDQLSCEDDTFKAKVKAFLDDLRSHYWLDGGRLAVVHAGLKEEMIGRCSSAVHAFALYGERPEKPTRSGCRSGLIGPRSIVALVPSSMGIRLSLTPRG
jgi:protein phosphatase